MWLVGAACGWVGGRGCECACACMHACVRACVRACLRACVCACLTLLCSYLGVGIFVLNTMYRNSNTFSFCSLHSVQLEDTMQHMLPSVSAQTK